MKNFVVIFGPPAVGKMTVGQEIAAITGYKLFHNHMTIDLLTKLFPFGSSSFGILNNEFRRRIIEEFVLSSDLKGLIFTYVWSLDATLDKSVIDEYKEIVESGGGQVFFVELEADFDERIARNKTENRLKHKNKAKIEQTEATIRDWEKKIRMNSQGDFFYKNKNYIKINNTHLQPSEVAARVVSEFKLIGDVHEKL